MDDNKVTEHEKEQLLSSTGTEKDTDFENAMFNKLADVPGFQDYLLMTMARDMKRYFIATKENQEQVRGHYNFAEYMYKKVVLAKDKMSST